MSNELENLSPVDALRKMGNHRAAENVETLDGLIKDVRSIKTDVDKVLVDAFSQLDTTIGGLAKTTGSVFPASCETAELTKQSLEKVSSMHSTFAEIIEHLEYIRARDIAVAQGKWDHAAERKSIQEKMMKRAQH